MHKWGDSMVSSPRNLLRLASAAALALLVALPGWAAAPTGFQEADIGAPDAAGSTVVNADGTWSVMGSGNEYQNNPADQLHYVYKSVKGDGSVQVKLLAQAQPGNQYVGPMIRASTAAGDLFAADVMSTSAVN